MREGQEELQGRPRGAQAPAAVPVARVYECVCVCVCVCVSARTRTQELGEGPGLLWEELFRDHLYCRLKESFS